MHCECNAKKNSASNVDDSDPMCAGGNGNSSASCKQSQSCRSTCSAKCSQQRPDESP